MKNKLYTFLDYATLVVFILVIASFFVLFISSIIDSIESAEATPVEIQETVEEVVKTNIEPQKTILEVIENDVPEKTEEPTEVEVENELMTEIIETSTESESITESFDEVAKPENNEIIYFDVALDTDLQDHIFELCENRGIDPAIVVSMIFRESGFNPEAVGDGGNSLGLMQIQPRWNGARMDEFGCYDLLDPYQNVTVGIDCFADYYDESGSIEWALMAYNGGPSYANNLWSSGQISGYALSVLSYAESIRNN